MERDERAARQFVFGEVAETYETHRPQYPAELFDDVIDLAGLGTGDRVLELGAGTGKATRGWRSRGLEVVALEPDERMAARARERLEDVGGVEVIVSTFEEWDPDGRPVDLVAAAQSWHWIDPEVAYPKVVEVLEEEGWLALFWNYPVDPGAELADPIDEIYARVVPEMRSRFAGNRGSKTDLPWEDRLREHGFADITERSYAFEQIYTSEQYVGLLRTHSDHRLLEAHRRETLLAEIAGAIDAAGGTLAVTYECRLYLARVAT